MVGDATRLRFLGILRSAARPVHRAGEGDLTVYDHGFRVGNPSAVIDRRLGFRHELEGRSRFSVRKGLSYRRSA